MAINRWSPFDELDRWFEEFPGGRRLAFELPVNLYEEHGTLIAKMHVPDIDPEKLNISVEDDTLRISGWREEEREEVSKEFYRKEIRSGRFSRAVRLPKLVDVEKIDAAYKEGVLQVMMPIIAGERGSGVKVKVRTA